MPNKIAKITSLKNFLKLNCLNTFSIDFCDIFAWMLKILALTQHGKGLSWTRLSTETKTNINLIVVQLYDLREETWELTRQKWCHCIRSCRTPQCFLPHWRKLPPKKTARKSCQKWSLPRKDKSRVIQTWLVFISATWS